jgi:ABC-type transport system involved in cytochrome c biogenesis permease component
MLVVEAVAVAFVALIFRTPLLDAAGRQLALLLLGTVGFAAVAALFGASLGRARSREILLPLLTYPIVVPVLIAGARGTAALLVGDELDIAGFWIKFLLVFDAVFVSLGLWVFEPLVQGEA